MNYCNIDDLIDRLEKVKEQLKKELSKEIEKNKMRTVTIKGDVYDNECGLQEAYGIGVISYSQYQNGLKKLKCESKEKEIEDEIMLLLNIIESVEDMKGE